MAENKTYTDKFVEKYSTEAVDNFLYEYKTGEFQTGEIIGMVSLVNQCEGTKFEYEKDTTQEYNELVEFITEEGYRETDLQRPVLGC